MEQRNYNPEGSALRRDQLELLKILKFIDSICKKNHILWWLDSGTLLGAARHQGFIPWDDDIDIVLLKKDYVKLEKILINLNHDEYVFHCMKTDIDYVNAFGKFRCRHGRIHVNSPRYNYYKWKGIGLDIFSIEKTNYLAAHLAHVFYYRFQNLTKNIKQPWVRKPLIRTIEFIAYGVVNPILRIIGLYNPQQEYHYSLGTGWPKQTYYMKYIFPLTESVFEGEMMPVPKNIDASLSHIYGDWRTLPSEEEIKKSIHCQEYRDEIFGKME